MKPISSHDARQRWHALVAEIADSGEPIIVERYGNPTLVVIPVTEYEELQALRAWSARRSGESSAGTAMSERGTGTIVQEQ